MTFDYKNPDYVTVFRERMDRLKEIRRDPTILPVLKAYYRDHPADFISDWGVTFDPRNVERKLPSVIPFILFPKQREWIDWALDLWRSQRPGLSEKSRDCGLSYVAVEFGCAMCLHYDGFSIGFGSRKEEYVDKSTNPKSLFWKARFFMRHLPEEFRGGWTEWRDAPHMRISFPESGSVMTGEAGDQIGRGDRQSIYVIDEAQPLDARIMTPDGYKSMADMHVGCVVLGQNGRPQKVIGINDCGVHDIYRVTFSDGTSTECSPNHLWTVDKVWGSRKRQTLRTCELMESYVYESPGGQTQYRYRVPVCEPVQFSDTGPLPLDPYLVGALLGDGSVGSGTIRITTADAEIVESFRQLLPNGVVIGAYDGRYGYNVVDEVGRGRRAGSRARIAVTAAGISGFKSPDKFVPDTYKFSSPKNRLSILQGLLDTDGSATGGAASFYSSSLRLAEDVRFIVQSLGGSATINRKPDARGYRDQYDVHLMLPTGAPFRLTRKLAKFRKRTNPAHRTIVSVAHVRRGPVRCISVDAPNGLYLTDSFIVTHNSAFLERPVLIEHALSQTTNCRIDISSVNGMNNPFAQKRHGGKIPVFVFDWRDDPRKDQAWYEKQVEELDPVTVAQEIDRDYSASVEGVVIPGAWVRSALDARQRLVVTPTGERSLALDVADEGTDKNALCGGKGFEIEDIEEWSGKGDDIFGTVERTFEFCDERGYTRFKYDADGLGAGVRGDARIINERRKAAQQKQIIVDAFRGSGEVHDPEGLVYPGRSTQEQDARKNKDFFGNRKAQGWWNLRTRFQKTHRWVTQGVKCSPDEIISIPSKHRLAQKLVTELSQPTYSINAVGKIIVDKTPAGTQSPNLGDGVMMRFSPASRSTVVISDEALAMSMRRTRR